MRGRLGRLVLDNWPIKLAALALALLLYVRVQTLRVHTEEFAVTLDVAVPADRRLIAPPPPVLVTVAGTGSELLGLRRLPGVIRTAIPDSVTGPHWAVRLQPADVTIPSGLAITVLDVQPREVVLALDTVAVRYVRVVPFIGTPPESGFVAPETFEVTPRAVRVVGAAAAVGTMDSVLTAPLDLRQATGPFLRRADLDTTGLAGLRVAPRAVTVSGEVGALLERVLTGVPVESGAGGIADVTPVPARVNVNVRGPEARVRALTRDSLQIVAHATGGTGRGGRFARLTVIAPPGILAHAVPDSVLLTPRSGRP